MTTTHKFPSLQRDVARGFILPNITNHDSGTQKLARVSPEKRRKVEEKVKMNIRKREIGYWVIARSSRGVFREMEDLYYFR